MRGRPHIFPVLPTGMNIQACLLISPHCRRTYAADLQQTSNSKTARGVPSPAEVLGFLCLCCLWRQREVAKNFPQSLQVSLNFSDYQCRRSLTSALYVPKARKSSL